MVPGTWVCMGWDGSTCSECLPVVTCRFSGLCAPRSRATDLGQGPHLRRDVRADSLRAPAPRAREKTHRQKRKMTMCKKKHLHMVFYIAPASAQIPQNHTRLLGTYRWYVVEQLLQANSTARRNQPCTKEQSTDTYVRADESSTTQASRQSRREPHHVVKHINLHLAVSSKRKKKSKAAGSNKTTTYKQQQQQQQQQQLAGDARRVDLYFQPQYHMGSLKNQIYIKTNKPNIWRQKKKKKTFKARQGHIKHVCKISGSYLSKTVWTLIGL